MLLEFDGHTVTTAGLGQEALDLLSSSQFDLVTTDYAMPGMNGVEVISELRRRLPHLPIVLATGYADMERVEAVMKLENVLRKPFPISELEAVIRNALAENV